VRVGHAFGARDARAVSRAGWTAFVVTMGYVALSAATMLVFPRLLIAPFLAHNAADLDEIVALALSFVQIAALFQLFDGAQAARSPICCAGYTIRAAGGDGRSSVIGRSALQSASASPFSRPYAGRGLWIGLAFALAAGVAAASCPLAPPRTERIPAGGPIRRPRRRTTNAYRARGLTRSPPPP